MFNAAGIRQEVLLIYLPGDQADRRWIGSYIWNINELGSNERASVREKS